MSLTRRQFMVGCSAAIAAMAGSRVGNLIFDNPDIASAAGSNPGSDDILLVVFLRGGCDGLSLVSPYDDPTYTTERGNLALKNALTIAPNNPGFGATSSFGLHPNAGPLKELYDARKLAIVHACGLDDDTRSHFDAMDYMERGTPGNKTTSSGWLTRHLATVTSDDASLIPALAANNASPASLIAEARAVSMNDPKSYDIDSHWRYTDNTSGNGKFKDAMLKTVEGWYIGSDLLNATGKRTLETIRAMRQITLQDPTVTYPDGGFGSSLKSVAQLIKANIGLRVATVDLGGWDHHESQGVNDAPWGPFYNLAGGLAKGLHAFYNDLPAYQNKLTVVVMSEFGRRLGKNASDGTDHGHGNMMLVLGGNVNGGKLYGKWPGLLDLDQQQDLKITTDYRTVLSEIVVRRLANPRLGAVFPGLTAYKPLGLLNGTDLPVDLTPLL